MIPPLLTYTEMLSLRASDPEIEMSERIEVYDGSQLVGHYHVLSRPTDGKVIAWFISLPGDPDKESNRLLSLAAKDVQEYVGPTWQP